MKVLVADDIPMIRKLVEYHLKQIGFDISNAADGVEALMLASNFRYDLILLDIMMPEMDGLEVLRRLRTDSLNKNTPIIMMTAYGDSESVKRAVDLGASDFIVKPVEQISFRKKVLDALNSRSPGDVN
ncbi:MAG: response regulator [Bacteroidetes bacterium]|jgi:DNA-binding response OmpR family regulator|nr:response regulator [Bacteroidota bacterium]